MSPHPFFAAFDVTTDDTGKHQKEFEHGRHIATTQSCHCDTFGMKSLLDYLCSLQVLECHGSMYTLTPTAATFLVKGRRAYVSDMILHYTDKALFDNIQQSLRSDQPFSLGEDFVQDAWLESHLPWRTPRSLEMWQAAGIKTEGQERLQILDIACGCAIKSLALAQASPHVQVTCLDTADVSVIDYPMATDGPTETTSFLPLVLWANSGGAAHSFEMYWGWLSDSGFGQIRQLNERWVVAVK